MPKQVLAWQCRYCGSLKKTEKIAVRHEKSCTQNPNPRNCILCQYSYKEKIEDDFLIGYGKLICSKRGCDCSKAVSADCPVFKRKEFNGEGNSNLSQMR
jgi:hypothetical protein